MLAYQKSADGFDYQLSYFNRYSQLHFIPDTIGDLVFNGVASDVYRQSVINGIQEDTSYRIGFAHTLRFGFSASAERTLVNNAIHGVAARCLGQSGRCAILGVRFKRQDRLAVRHLSSGRMEDHQQSDGQRRAALRPDGSVCRRQSAQPAHQPDLETVRRHHVPCRLCAQLHAAGAGAGGADQSRRWWQNTTAQPQVFQNNPVQPERSNVFDVGVVQKIYAIPGLEVGIDGYYKTATDLLDDGQFGQAYVLTAFNYARGENVGVEFKANYTNGNFRAYGNLAWAKQIATDVVSNQYSVRTGRTQLYRQQQRLYRSRPVPDRVGRRILSVERHALQRVDDLRQRLRNGFANTGHRSLLHPGQSRDVARFHWYRRPSRPRCASTSSICSTRSTRSGTAPASAYSRRSSDRGAASFRHFAEAVSDRVVRFESAPCSSPDESRRRHRRTRHRQAPPPAGDCSRPVPACSPVPSEWP